MFGSRCTECGEVRWSILGRAEKTTECPSCGGAMVVERRYPGRRIRERAERRDVPGEATSGTDSKVKLG